MKKILITGVSRGLGKILANFFASSGYMVYGTVRDTSQYKDSKNIKYLLLDLENNGSIDRLAEQIEAEVGHLDAIIHNAGIAYLNPTDEIYDHERRKIFDVNFFGPVKLTEKLLPGMRRAKSGRIIFISSVTSVDPWPSLGVYSASKSALERVAFEWSVLLKKWNIHVSIIRPNPLPTDMQMQKSAKAPSGEYDVTFCNDLEWENTENVCSAAQKIIEESSPAFEFTSGEISRQTIDSLLLKGAYEELANKYVTKLSQLEKLSSH